MDEGVEGAAVDGADEEGVVMREGDADRERTLHARAQVPKPLRKLWQRRRGPPGHARQVPDKFLARTLHLVLRVGARLLPPQCRSVEAPDQRRRGRQDQPLHTEWVRKSPRSRWLARRALSECSCLSQCQHILLLRT